MVNSKILSIIQQQASRIMDTGNMFIALYEPEKDFAVFELAFIDGVPVDIRNEPKMGAAFWRQWPHRMDHSKQNSSVTFTKVDAEKWYDQPNARNYIEQTFASWLGVPIMFGNEVLGVIATYNKTEEI